MVASYIQAITPASLHQLNSYSEAQDVQLTNWLSTQKAESPEIVEATHVELGVAEQT